MTRLILTLFGIGLIFSACDENGTDDRTPSEGDMAFVLNEGVFGSSNAEITGYDLATGESHSQYFNQLNSAQIGDVGQSMTVIDDNLFIVANNSHRIQVADASSLEQQESIEIGEEASPRFIAAYGDNQAVVTNLISDSLAVVDLNNHEQSGWINLGGNSAEEIAIEGEDALIRQTEYDFETESLHSRILHFDFAEEAVVDTLEFDGSPNGFVTDSEGNAWVRVGGEAPYLSVRDVESGDELDRFDLPEAVSSITFDTDGNRVYGATASGIIEINKSNGEVEDGDFVTREGLASVGFDFLTRSYILAGTSPDYESRDDVIVFDLDGEEVDSFQAGFGPHQFHFSE